MNLPVSDTTLDTYRQQGDPLADAAVQALFAQPDQVGLWQKQLREVRGNSTPIPEGMPAEVHTFFGQSQLPSWADKKLMKEGAKFFAFHSQDIMSLLGYYSLPYCYASEAGVQVLHHSERMGHDTTKRLAETGSFVFDVLKLDAFEPQGYGHRSIQQVRLLHASIRYHLTRRGNWDEKHGLPINQEDMVATNLAFSLVILRGLRKLGHSIPPKQIEAYLYLWSVIGFVMGIDESLIPANAKEAYWIDRHITTRHFKACAEGKALTKALLDSMKQLSPPLLPKGFAPTFMRFLLGKEVADILGLPKGDWSINLVKSRRQWNKASSFFQIMEFAKLEQKVAETEALTKSHIVITPGYTVASK